MDGLSTHVLDTTLGLPAAGVAVELFRATRDSYERLAATVTDANGRNSNPLLEGAAFVAGRYRLVFAAADYFRRRGLTLPAIPFLDRVTLDFGIADPSVHYHVPLLLSPWSYTTYRGS